MYFFFVAVLEGPREVTPTVLKEMTGLEGESCNSIPFRMDVFSDSIGLESLNELPHFFFLTNAYCNTPY
jgi:hypothetical protein